MMVPGSPSQKATAFFLFLVVAATGEGQLIQIDSCTCPGGTLVYNCAVVGAGFTIWKGSAFNCPSSDSEIFLSHSLFRGSGASGFCNDGALFGRSIGVSEDNTVYTSQLTVNLTADSSVVGERVECDYFFNGVETTIGSSVINDEVPGALPPPTIVQLAKVDQNELIFSWRAVDSNCSSIQYGVHSNCGTCNISDAINGQTNKTCNIEQSTTFETQCTFAVRTIICGNISGMFSDDILLRLKVPEPPQASDVHVTPYYNASDDKLIGLDVTFIELNGFFISSGVNGSATSYTISYTNSITNTLCDSLTIDSTQSCSQGVCTVPSLDPLPCSDTIQDGGVVDIAISATNVLGTGPASEAIQVDLVNRLVDIVFESSNRLVCVFLQNQGRNSKSCDIAYGACGQAHTISVQGNANSTNTIMINLPSDSTLLSDVYCYTVNASTDNTFVLVQGSRRNSHESQGGPNVTSIVVALVLLLLLSVVTIITIIVIVIVREKKRLQERRFRFSNVREGSEVVLLAHYDSRRGSVVSIVQRTVFAHIKLCLEDKPKELLNVLKKLTDKIIDIKAIKIRPQIDSSVSANSLPLKTIYIECENDLTEYQKTAIQGMEIGYEGSLTVNLEAQRYDVNCDLDSEVKVTEHLMPQSGALVGLLEFVYSLDGWQHININDIEITSSSTSESGEYYVVLKFQSNVSQEWKDEFDNEKYKCEFIVQTEPRTRSMTF